MPHRSLHSEGQPHNRMIRLEGSPAARKKGGSHGQKKGCALGTAGIVSASPHIDIYISMCKVVDLMLNPGGKLPFPTGHLPESLLIFKVPKSRRLVALPRCTGNTGNVDIQNVVHRHQVLPNCY